jgi:mannosyltransferase
LKVVERIPTWVLITVLTLTALILRLLYLNSTDIAGDEPFSIFVAQFELSKIISYLSTGNNPPLFEILLHFYIRLVGGSDFYLRLLPAIFSAVTVIPIILTGKKFFNTRVAIIASLLFIFSIFQIRFAHEVRVYSLFSLVTAWSLYFFLSVLQRPSSLKLWGLLVLCNVVLMYSHFTSFYVLLTEFVCGILFVPKARWKFLFVSLALSGLFFLPYILVFITRLNDVASSGTWVLPPSLGELYGSINLMLNQRITTLVVIITVWLGLVLSRETSVLEKVKEMYGQQKTLAVFAWFGLPYFLMFACSVLYVPMFIDRYILYTSIPLFLSVALVADQAWKNSPLPLLGVLLIGCGSFATTNLNPSNNREIGAAVDFVKELKTENSQVYLCPDHYNLAFAFHYNRSLFNEMARHKGDSFLELNEHLMANGIFPIRDKQQLNLGQKERIIYLDADSRFVLPESHILETLEDELSLKKIVHFEQIFDVYVFDQFSDKRATIPIQTSE